MGAGYGSGVGLDDDEDCAHVFELQQLHPTPTGMQRVNVCRLCGTPAYDPGQAAIRDRRPPLGAGDTT